MNRGNKFRSVAAIAILATVAFAIPASASTDVVEESAPTTPTVAMPIASTPGTVAPASSGCVTRAEYRSVRRGNTMARVHRVWDTRGHRVSYAESGGYAAQVRTYDVCGSSYSAVAAAFDRKPGGAWRLSAKSAVWVY